jgi:predicted ABC-type exoprotein transport system permease subunit
MNKKLVLFLMLFLFFFKHNYGQEIKVYPAHLMATSLVIISVEEIGKYKLMLKSESGDKIFVKKFEIFDKKKFSFKYNFKNFDKGDYTFELSSKRKIIANKKISKN